MNYREFVKVMQAEVKRKEEPEVAVEICTARKNNGRIRCGLVLTRRGSSLSPTIYLEEFYDQYLGGAALTDLVRNIHELYKQAETKKSGAFESLSSYEKIKDRIVYQLIQRESNRELLQEVPYEEYKDLAVVYYLLLGDTPLGTATLLVRKEHLDMWGVEEKEVKEAARKNTPRLLAVEMIRLSGFLYVITNTAKCFGAAVMLYPGLWERIGDILGEDFYILPSSIHELILIPVSYGMDRTYLQMMVKEVNTAEVAEEEVLSDSVYFYSRKEGKITG